ncbi:MAG: GNAT family N-acetyltransferase [Methanomassiliicoccales archaeon]
MTLEQAFSCLPTLTTRRLRLRQIQESDAEAVHAFKTDAEVTGRFGEDPHRTVDETRTWIASNRTGYERHEAMTWAIVLIDQDVVIGECCLWNFGPGQRCAEIGYELHREHWHKGIMTEALRELIRHGFSDLRLHRIEADTLRINPRSMDLLLRLGFAQEALLRERHFHQGKFHDQVFFGLLRDGWRG